MLALSHTGNKYTLTLWFNIDFRFSDQQYPSLKVGETNVPRNYYEKATTEHPNGEKCLTNYSRFGTDYRENVSSTV